jgi:hypothetical protein
VGRRGNSETYVCRRKGHVYRYRVLRSGRRRKRGHVKTIYCPFCGTFVPMYLVSAPKK